MSHVEASDLFALMHGSHPLVLIRPAPRVAKLNERMPCSAGVPCANMRSEQNQFHTRPPEAKAAGTVIVLSDKNAPAPGSAAGSAPAPGSALLGRGERLQQGAGGPRSPATGGPSFIFIMARGLRALLDLAEGHALATLPGTAPEWQWSWLDAPRPQCCAMSNDDWRSCAEAPLPDISFFFCRVARGL